MAFSAMYDVVLDERDVGAVRDDLSGARRDHGSDPEAFAGLVLPFLAR